MTLIHSRSRAGKKKNTQPTNPIYYQTYLLRGMRRWAQASLRDKSICALSISSLVAFTSVLFCVCAWGWDGERREECEKEAYLAYTQKLLCRSQQQARPLVFPLN